MIVARPRRKGHVGPDRGRAGSCHTVEASLIVDLVAAARRREDRTGEEPYRASRDWTPTSSPALGEIVRCAYHVWVRPGDDLWYPVRYSRAILKFPNCRSRSLFFFATTIAGLVACGTSSDDETPPPSSDAGTSQSNGDAGTTQPHDDAGTSEAGGPTKRSYAIRGSVTDVRGSGLILANAGESLPIAAGAASFAFTKTVAEGAAYDVTVASQPADPKQTCTVLHGSGKASKDVTDVEVHCTNDVFPIDVTVNGLEGSGLVLQNNGADDLALAPGNSSSVTGSFATKIESGSDFEVTVKTQPSSPAQQCTVAGGKGTIVAGAVSVTVSCQTKRAVGGSVSGLAGTGLRLKNNDGDEVAVNATTFAFPTPLLPGAAYHATISSQPKNPWQTCTIEGADGVVGASDVDSVAVTCETDEHTVGGTITGLAGKNTQLRLNGTVVLDVAAGATSFVFPTSIASGKTYTVEVSTQPSSPTQNCTVTAGTGTIEGADVGDVAIDCSTSSFYVGGQVTGTVGAGLVLRNNDNADDEITMNAAGPFEFTNKVSSGSTYDVTLEHVPDGYRCVLSGGSGTVTSEDIASVLVECVPVKKVFVTSMRFGGNLGGLAGADGKCQDLATIANLSGTYKAWLSDTTGSPSTRFTHSTGPYILVNGTVVANSYADLVSGGIRHAIDLTEYGNPGNFDPLAASQKYVWSNTMANGAQYVSWASCNNWMVTDGSANGNWGSAAAVDGTWSSLGTATCNFVTAPLYCFEQ